MHRTPDNGRGEETQRIPPGSRSEASLSQIRLGLKQHPFRARCGYQRQVVGVSEPDLGSRHHWYGGLVLEVLLLVIS